MIKSVIVKGGFASKLPALANERKFEFTDGFNAIYGQNGVGKSVLGKIMAGYCGIAKGGWTQISDPAVLASKTQNQFPWLYRRYAMDCDSIVEWDGTPTFYNDSDLVNKNDTTWFFSKEAQSADGITSESEQLDIMATKPSSGQYRIHKINKIMQIIKMPPNLSVVPPHVSEKQYAQLEVNYINSLPRNGKTTLILDEPEKALSLPRQLQLFDTIKKLSHFFQVIVITHSPFILFQEDVNLIDMEANYSKVCTDLIDKEVAKKRKRKKAKKEEE